MRPRQWTKNVIVYAGIVFDGQLFVPSAFLAITVSFALLCLISSGVYVINDLVDIERDRLHPKKRFRPLPAGELSVPVALAAAVVLPLIAVGVALTYSPPFAAVLVFYLLLQLAYSFRLKHIPIVDVMTMMVGFILRVAAGVIVVNVAAFSPWLYACTGLLALFLAVGKRRQELLLMADKAGSVRTALAQYNLPLLDDMLRLVITSTFIAYMLYAIEAPSALLAGTQWALLTVPFVLYGLFRYLFLIHVKGEGSAPDEVLLKDRPLQIAIGLWALTILLILYLPALRTL
jgi:4-hydroxybenzoate polyprenyltransferase